MRVESDTNKPEANPKSVQFHAASNPLLAKTAEAANQGAFSKVLDVARETSEKGRADKPAADADNDTSIDKTSDGKNDEAVEAKNGNRDDQKNSSGDGDGGGEGDPAWVPAPVPAAGSAGETNTAIPQARSILHVADLERIVSAVRSDTFAGAKQVTIDLKNSVLDGLRIQITLSEQGNIKAEFIALNEQIKKQLDARKSELQSVLKDRSIKCTELSISVLTPEKENISANRNNG